MKKWNIRKKRICFGIIAVVLTVVTGTIAYAWLVNHNAMITMAPVIHPGNIAITGPGGSAMEALDLSYGDENVSDENGRKRVTVQRGICVKSTEEQFDLEIIHTTNMKGLEFSLYPAEIVSSGGNFTDGNVNYRYDPSSPLSGRNLNLERYTATDDGKLSHNYANQSKHGINFDSYANVQKHAEPLYWKVNGPLASDKTRTVQEDFAGETVTYYLTDYVLGITWIEENKETDIFYLVARNVDNSSQE